jgi:uncharacterized cupin superfamily protein
MKVQKASDKKHTLIVSKRTSEQYSRSFVISEFLESQDVFLSHEIIPPQNRSSAAHFHLETDEIIYVLEGSVLAVEESGTVGLCKGDSICFNANSGLAHYLENQSESDAHVLVVRKHLPSDDTVFAPRFDFEDVTT